jgi:hypothetical protein
MQCRSVSLSHYIADCRSVHLNNSKAPLEKALWWLGHSQGAPWKGAPIIPTLPRHSLERRSHHLNTSKAPCKDTPVIQRLSRCTLKNRSQSSAAQMETLGLVPFRDKRPGCHNSMQWLMLSKGLGLSKGLSMHKYRGALALGSSPMVGFVYNFYFYNQTLQPVVCELG